MGLTAGGYCHTTPQSLTLGRNSLLTWMSILLNGNLFRQMQGMFQPRVLDGAFLFPCLYSVTDTRAIGLPNHWTSPGTWPHSVCWGCSLRADFPQVWEHAALQPHVGTGSAPVAAFLVMSPCCWAGSYFFECSSIFSSSREQVINNAY